jgi:LacI family transcriptional regulator
VTVTIHDVATHARVSPATVSNTLSGRRSVSPDTRARVLRSVELLGYRPNTAAHTLRTGVHHAIGLVMPDVTNPFFGEVARGAEDAAQAQGSAVFLGNTGLDDSRQDEYLSRLSRASDGIIVFPTTAHIPRLHELIDRGVPVVICDERQEVGVPAAGGVFSDNIAGGRMVGEHFVQRGARCCAFIGGPADLPTSRDRYAGYLAGLATGKRSCPPARSINGPYTRESGGLAVQELLRRSPKTDAVFAADDLIAVGAMEALKAAGRSIGDDVLVCGFDDISWASLAEPSLSSVRQQSHQMGVEAARMLLEMVHHNALPRQLTLSVSLQVRGTSSG